MVSSRAKLDFKMGYLMIRTEETVTRIHISEIAVLMIESTAVSLTAYLLCELAEAKVNIIFCDNQRNPDGVYLPFYGSHDCSQKVKFQIQWTVECKQAIWQKIVAAKITGQMKMLLTANKTAEAEKLKSYLPDIQPGDTTNREGHAAKVYFNALFGKGFTRTDEENPINAELNYGYSILLSAVSREVVSNGYLTQIGIHHDNQFNHLNLACDLMEPFRPFIDYVVVKLPNELNKDTKQKLIQVLDRKVIIDQRQQSLLNALIIYVKSVLDCLSSQNAAMIKFPDYDFKSYESNSIL